MRSLLGSALALIVLAAPAVAQDRYILNQNQTGLALPGVNVPNGFDEVRTADGVSCHSSNTGNGAYADVGVIGANDQKGSMNNGAVYGRVVIPLGANGTRLDCRKLYELELERLKMEVRLLKSGLGHQVAAEATDQPLTTGSTVAAATGVSVPPMEEVSEPTPEWTLRGTTR